MKSLVSKKKKKSKRAMAAEMEDADGYESENS